MSILIDGKALAAEMRGQLSERVQKFKESRGKEIGLAVVLVGKTPPRRSMCATRSRLRRGRHPFLCYRLPETATQGEVEALVDELVASENVHGILVQLPLPAHLNERSIHAPHPRRQRT